MTERLTQFTNDGLTFDVIDSGPLDGEPIVLLHGFPERGNSWNAVARLLNDAGYRTFAPDQRGLSRGARPTSRRAYTMRKVAGDARALIDAVGGSAHLVGHDWGAAAAWATTQYHPDAVRTLTAVSVPHLGAMTKAMLTSRQGAKSWYMGAFQLPWLPEHLVGTAPFVKWIRAGGMSEEQYARFRSEVVEDGALRTALNWYRQLPFNDPRDASIPVVTPTTFVWSDADLYIGRHAAELCERYVTGPYHFVELTGVSHWVPTEAPKPLADAILERVRGE
ncbi:alpha/beta fold hydrolase [Nocardioides jiangxiensis]|uniref:Alpha/beta fold hydrolase n=1 Tax=Nocardioides jiangxiensis TaxID=3064524 RepID=A0ABT9AZ26_9ACTN|nr:alpha/beta fold hydrolase [Nocardioides sp. WY-20]MDO7867682.1 alpha/beta fold hydrolase [Nocardioides sp. WY-20]